MYYKKQTDAFFQSEKQKVILHKEKVILLEEFTIQRRLLDTGEPMTLRAGSRYTVILVAAGSLRAGWPGEQTLCGTESLLLLKPGGSAQLRSTGERTPAELCCVGLSPALLAELSGEGTDLEAAFNVVPRRQIALRADSGRVMLLKNLCRRMEPSGAGPEFAQPLYVRGLLQVFVVLVLRACIGAEHHEAAARRRHLILDEVFLYLQQHLTEDVTLADLEREFYVDRCHIAREFKRRTGQTVHRYLVKARLDLCRSLIEQGLPITEVYRQGGFGGYNHFFRAFKKEYGMTPREYYRSSRADAH